jgi:hypothetical protein
VFNQLTDVKRGGGVGVGLNLLIRDRGGMSKWVKMSNVHSAQNPANDITNTSV